MIGPIQQQASGIADERFAVAMVGGSITYNDAASHGETGAVLQGPFFSSFLFRVTVPLDPKWQFMRAIAHGAAVAAVVVLAPFQIQFCPRLALVGHLAHLAR